MGAFCTERVIAALPPHRLTIRAAARFISAPPTTLASRHARRGESLKSALDAEWLARATARLRAGERISVVAVAFASSGSAFTRKFRRLTGVTPSAWCAWQVQP